MFTLNTYIIAISQIHKARTDVPPPSPFLLKNPNKNLHIFINIGRVMTSNPGNPTLESFCGVSNRIFLVFVLNCVRTTGHQDRGGIVYGVTLGPRHLLSILFQP